MASGEQIANSESLLDISPPMVSLRGLQNGVQNAQADRLPPATVLTPHEQALYFNNPGHVPYLEN